MHVYIVRPQGNAGRTIDVHYYYYYIREKLNVRLGASSQILIMKTLLLRLERLGAGEWSSMNRGGRN